MPFSDVQICNLALSRIKVGYQIQALNELSQEAAACSLAYQFNRECALREYEWPFSGRFAALALIQSGLVPNWAYSYRLPANCLKVRRITTGEKSLNPDYAYTMGSDDVGLILHTDQTSPTIEYTHAIIDPTLFPADFASALAWRLAADIAIPLSANPGMAAAASAKYDEAISRAFVAAMDEVSAAPAADNEFSACRQQ